MKRTMAWSKIVRLVSTAEVVETLNRVIKSVIVIVFNGPYTFCVSIPYRQNDTDYSNLAIFV